MLVPRRFPASVVFPARFLLLAAGLLSLATGCAEHLRLRHQAPTGSWTGRLFWPPPAASSVWIGEPSDALGPTLVEAAAHLMERLDRVGYDDLRVVPIGLQYVHGFALVTRLERVAGSPSEGLASAGERWPASFPHPPELRWLAFASESPMPLSGRYRTLLVAFSDLPRLDRHRPPVECAETVMDGPDVAANVRLPHHPVMTRYRVSLHVYELDARSPNAPASMLDDGRTSEPAASLGEKLAL